jgi:hypothetical protein
LKKTSAEQKIIYLWLLKIEIFIQL